MRLGVADGRLRDGNVALCHAHIGRGGVFHGLRGFGCLDGLDIGLYQRLPPFVDVLGIGVIDLGLFDAGYRPLQIGLTLLDRRFGSRDLCLLLPAIEACEDRALCDAIADIGLKIDEDAGNLESDLGLNACLYGAEPEDLHRDVPLAARYLDADRTQQQGPGSKRRAPNQGERDEGHDNALAIHRNDLNALVLQYHLADARH